MQNGNCKAHILLLVLLLLSIGLTAQTFSPIFHEYDDFPNIDQIVHGDFNADGSMDFVIAGSFSGQVKVGLGDSLSKPVFTDLETNLNVTEIEVVDFDEDEDLDIVGSAPFANKSYVWLKEK